MEYEIKEADIMVANLLYLRKESQFMKIESERVKDILESLPLEDSTLCPQPKPEQKSIK